MILRRLARVPVLAHRWIIHALQSQSGGEYPEDLSVNATHTLRGSRLLCTWPDAVTGSLSRSELSGRPLALLSSFSFLFSFFFFFFFFFFNSRTSTPWIDWLMADVSVFHPPVLFLSGYGIVPTTCGSQQHGSAEIKSCPPPRRTNYR